MRAYRCEKCRKHFDGKGIVIHKEYSNYGNRDYEKIVEVCPRCFNMIFKFCKHKPKDKGD